MATSSTSAFDTPAASSPSPLLSPRVQSPPIPNGEDDELSGNFVFVCCFGIQYCFFLFCLFLDSIETNLSVIERQKSLEEQFDEFLISYEHAQLSRRQWACEKVALLSQTMEFRVFFLSVLFLHIKMFLFDEKKVWLLLHCWLWTNRKINRRR